MTKVLVAGATGYLGSKIVDLLLDLEFEVRLLVRKESLGKVTEFVLRGAEVVVGDLTDPTSLTNVCQNVDVLVTTPAALDDSLNAGYKALLHDADKNNLQQVVYVSNIPEPIGKHKMFANKKEIESLFITCGVPYTILRAEVFLNYLVDFTLVMGEKYGAATFFCSDAKNFGKVAHCFIDEHDLAALVVAVVGETDAYNEIIYVAGETALTFPELVSVYNHVNGKKLAINVSETPMPPYITDDIFGILDSTHQYNSRTNGKEVFARFRVPMTDIMDSVIR